MFVLFHAGDAFKTFRPRPTPLTLMTLVRIMIKKIKIQLDLIAIFILFEMENSLININNEVKQRGGLEEARQALSSAGETVFLSFPS